MASHVRIATRGMRTGGRRVPFPGLGGAPAIGSSTTSISPSVSTHPSQPVHVPELPAGFIPRRGKRHATPPAPSAELRDWTLTGEPIAHRPPRTIPVNLPSGYPEPPTYPPSSDYLDTVRDRRSKPHPLWQFFHIPKDARENPPDESQTMPRMGDSLDMEDGENESGRAWLTSELQAKSFADLHVLWYVLLKERNVLETQKLERRRLFIAEQYNGELLSPRLRKVRISMSRIKFVLNTRRLGLLAATGPHWDKVERQLAEQSEKETAAALQEGRPLPKPIRVATQPKWSDPRGTQLANRVPLEENPDAEKIKWRAEILERNAKLGQTGEESAVEAEEIEEEASKEEGAVAENVNQEEVEARDEGFGGGREAEEFVEGVQVDKDGKVKKVD